MSPGPAAGYSGTPLVKKLGIKEGARLRLVDAPAHYVDLLGGLPRGVALVDGAARDVDVVHLFATERKGLEARVAEAKRAMREDGMAWVSWPRRSSGVPTDVTEDVVREVALAAGLVDVKVCAVDATWSGLKLVVRLKDRSPKKTAKTARAGVERAEAAASVDEYLAGLEEADRAALERLRGLIREAAPEAEEVVSYRIPTYRLEGPLVHFAKQARHLSLTMVSASAVEAFRGELEERGFTVSGRTVHFSAERPLPAALVKRLVKLRVKENRAARG